MIFQVEFDPFVGAHQELFDFYDAAFQLVAEAGEKKSDRPWNKAVAILGTPEVEELCLGVTASGTRGAGAARGKAKLIAEAFHKAILFGLANPAHFETVQLFQEGIAEDTVSDAVGNILRHRFGEYTKAVCDELGVPTEQRPHLRGRFNPETRRWQGVVVDAPHKSIQREAGIVGAKAVFAANAYAKPGRLLGLLLRSECPRASDRAW